MPNDGINNKDWGAEAVSDTHIEKKVLTEGWKWLMNSNKAHYFRDGKSLCKRWMYLGKSFDPNQFSSSPDDCKGCAKRSTKEL